MGSSGHNVTVRAGFGAALLKVLADIYGTDGSVWYDEATSLTAAKWLMFLQPSFDNLCSCVGLGVSAAWMGPGLSVPAMEGLYGRFQP